ncbi:MAG: sugar phosphate isomerase/epimerase [Sphingomonadales bacterium]|nr:sugar phosphate isomerase/epimerase [Sphingomonadales bacterium]
MTLCLDRRHFLAGLAAASVTAANPALAARRKPLFERIGKPLGVQLYALGDAPRTDMAGTLRRLAAMGYRDFELPGFYGRPAKDLRADADAAGVRFGSIHLGASRPRPTGSPTLLSSPQELADSLGALGVTHAVLPLPPLPEHFSAPRGVSAQAALAAAIDSGGIDGWKRLGALLNERAAALKPHGIALGYHNHNVEFRPQEGTTGWAALLAELDPKLVFLELDLGWVGAAGLDPAAELHRLKGRVRMVHLKDIKASTIPNNALSQDPAEVGQGSLDWRTILPACVAAGVEHYYVEQEPPFTRDRFASMQISHDFLAQFVG